MTPQQGIDGSAGPLVLVVDDEEIVQRSVAKILSRAGYRAEGVFSAAEALQRLRAGSYQLVITDLMMPEMNGIEFLQSMRREGLQVPVLVITGYPTIRTALLAMRLGARDYLAKPFTRNELLGPVQRALRAEPAVEPGPPERPGEGGDLPAMGPGARFVLPHHSWVELEQDGRFRVGVEESFLAAVGPVAALQLPLELERLDQGAVAVRVTSITGEEHGVCMPLSGQVVAVNGELARTPELLKSGAWLVRIVPGRLESELLDLVRLR